MLRLTVSKAFLKSTKAPQAKLPLSQVSQILFATSMKAWLVDILVRKYYCFSNRREFFFKKIFVSYELIFQLAYLGLTLEKLDYSCCSLSYPLAIVLRLIRYENGFVITCRLFVVILSRKCL